MVQTIVRVGSVILLFVILINLWSQKKEREAVAIVNDENSSLAIGKKGQNVKLASRLTKYKIAIKKAGELDEE